MKHGNGAVKRTGIIVNGDKVPDFLLITLCGRSHNLSFVALSVMWRRLKAPVAGPNRAFIGVHINKVAAARAHLLTAGRTGCSIGRDAGGVSKASGAGVIREHASPCETGRPVINEPAPQ